MARKNALERILEPNDGRRFSECIVSVREGEQLQLVSTGWDCDSEGDSIIVYKFLYLPDNPKCDQAVLVMWTKDVECSPLETVEVPRVKLTRGNTHDIIDECGSYLLVRQRGAEAVRVIGKHEKKQG